MGFILIGVASALAGSGWAPPRGATLPEVPEHGWRQARVAEDVPTGGFRVAVDALGRVLLAVTDADGASVQVRRLDPRAGTWEDVATFNLPQRGAGFALSTDGEGVLLGVGGLEGRVAVHRLPGGEVLWTTQVPDFGRNHFAVDGPSRTVVASGYSHELQIAPGIHSARGEEPWTPGGPIPYLLGEWGPTAGRLAWMAWGLDGGEWSIRGAWPDVPVRQGAFLTSTADGPVWRALSAVGHGRSVPPAGGGGPRLDIASRAAFTTTHYDIESNWLRVQGADGPLGPDLVLPDTFLPQVFETDPPVVVFPAGGDLFVARWDGAAWWGPGRPGRDDRGVPTPGQVAPYPLSITSDRRLEVFIEGVGGSASVVLTRRGRAWSAVVREPPRVRDEQVLTSWTDPCREGAARVWTAWEAQGDVVSMFPWCDGSFDRINGDGVLPGGFVRGPDGLEAVSNVPECAFERGVRLADGSVLASFLDPEASTAALYRLAEGAWTREVVPAELANAGVGAFVARDGAVWAAFSGTGDAVAVARRGPEGWSVLPDPEALLGGPLTFEVPSLRFGRRGLTPPLEMVVGREGEVHVLRDGRLARFQEGRWTWGPAFDATDAHQVELALRRDGTPILAIRGDTGIRVVQLAPDRPRGLDGDPDGRVWAGRASGLAVAVDRRDRVCVAFTAPDVRMRRVGVLCHR